MQSFSHEPSMYVVGYTSSSVKEQKSSEMKTLLTNWGRAAHYVKGSPTESLTIHVAR